MISKKLSDLLIAQIGHELSAHQHYFGIALYFERQSLDGWGKLFREQSKEEAEHAAKIVRFLTDCGVEFDLPAIGAASTKFAAPIKAIESALASEQRVTKQFQTMAATAMAEKDFVGFQFLQWFLDEQVEEEAKMQKLIDLVKSGVNLFQSEAMLASFE